MDNNVPLESQTSVENLGSDGRSETVDGNVTSRGPGRVSAEFEYQFPDLDEVPAHTTNLFSINQDGSLVFLTFGLAVPAILRSEQHAAELVADGPLPARVVARVVMPPQTFFGFVRAAVDQNNLLWSELVSESRQIIRQADGQSGAEEGEKAE